MSEENQSCESAQPQEQSFPYYLPMRELYEQRERFLGVPWFQREFVWPEWKCKLLIESMLRGAPVPQLEGYEREEDNGTARFYLIDGIQRLNAVLRFMSGGYKTITVEQKKNRLPGSPPPVEPGRYFDQLSPYTRNIFLRYKFTIAYTPDTSPQGLSIRFITINEGNFPLTPAERYHAFPSKANEAARTVAKHPFWEQFYDHFDNARRKQVFQSSLYLLHLEMLYPRITFDLLAFNQTQNLAYGKHDNLVTDTLIKNVLDKLDRICFLYHGSHFSHRSATVAMYQSIGYLEQAGYAMRERDKGILTPWMMGLLMEMQRSSVDNRSKPLQQMLRENKQKEFWARHLTAVLALFGLPLTSIEIAQPALVSVEE